jgi:hypothetical protein
VVARGLLPCLMPVVRAERNQPSTLTRTGMCRARELSLKHLDLHVIGCPSYQGTTIFGYRKIGLGGCG